jgi:SAM-dependent methyltransferase
MSDWGQGYHVGIPYTSGFYSELAPNHLESALLFAGFKADLARSGARYCELGCGYGLTTLILAASNPHMSFVGVDFNPTHIVAANALAESAQLTNVRFVETSFDELLDPRFSDLGEFDIIALHGVYSWVAPAIRRAIVKFADARLKTGGALYVSYNAAPGWMPRAPLQRLLFEGAKRNPAEPRTATADALRFAKSMKDAGAFYFKANPQVGAFIESMQGMNLAYLVHEHLNESWSALYHADVVADFSPTRLSYACAAHIADDLDETSVPIDTHGCLSGISDGVWRETVQDFLVGRSFRRDIFARGPVRLTPLERMKALERTFMLVVPRSAATAKIPTPMGEVEGRSDLYPVVLDLLSGGPMRLSELLARATGPAKDPPTLIQALALLIHAGRIKMIRPDAKIDPGPARRLNLALTREIAAGKAIRVLAAPAIGTGISAELTDFGWVLAAERGLSPDAGVVARATWEMIEATPIRPVKDGNALQQKSEALAYLTQAAERLLTEKREILQALGIQGHWLK